MNGYEKLFENLKQNGMVPVYVEKRQDVKAAVEKLLFSGCSIGVGGSVTLNQTDLFELFCRKDYTFYDRYNPSLDKDGVKEVMKKTLTADVFVCSANAVTEQGELYLVDGNSNRVAPVLYGPERVIIVVGKNKIVPDVAAAVRRVKTVAAPLNAKRLNCKTPCAATGECVCPNEPAGAGCRTEERICSNYCLLAKQRNKDRIFVVLCDEALGY